MSLNQLSMLLGLPDIDLRQIVDYATTLSKAEAADHFKNLLGDSPQAIEFISAFNSRRREPKPVPGPTPPQAQAQPPSSAQQSALPANQSQSQPTDQVPKRQRQPKKKKPQIHTPAPRQIAATDLGPGTVYQKAREDDYYAPARSAASGSASGASTPSKAPSRTPTPAKGAAAAQKQQKQAGSLISDLLAPPKSKSRPNSKPPSRSATPGPATPTPTPTNAATTTKISITGGLPMHGASGAIADLDAAIRALEITTNPSLSSNGRTAGTVAARRCNCVATRHPLQTAAPNCLHCGKVICLKEGLGPCTSCGHPLLTSEEVQAMIRELKVERGREKQAADKQAHRRPDVASAPRPFTQARTGFEHEADSNTTSSSEAERRAREHRDKLLTFQAQNARRTTVRDEAADFDVSLAGGGSGSMWASPEERARELKRQQKLVREMEWNARPDYEKRQQVVSIDLVGGKVIKKMAAKERPPTPEEILDDNGHDHGHNSAFATTTGRTGSAGSAVLSQTDGNKRTAGGGAFSKNPLLGGMIKPVYDAKGKGVALEGRKDRATPRWRRVQDNMDDNEGVILDGGIYGGSDGQDLAATGSLGDEPDFG
ncbi:hypothetical protein BD289DRAFT_445837 [Coniella lustricola]|uniref:TRIP4/RQT4 C2HC5-type zinc finger domain-containing protein n=1 Tax=Coniella lustricola TaxID=2025994 RepID=A0A2T2ZUI7_9PEZI|nr:hypothetical protein BD289DRAFT_445837 [Coniella lustricola]